MCTDEGFLKTSCGVYCLTVRTPVCLFFLSANAHQQLIERTHLSVLCVLFRRDLLKFAIAVSYDV